MGPWKTATFNGLQTIERGSFPLNVKPPPVRRPLTAGAARNGDYLLP